MTARKLQVTGIFEQDAKALQKRFDEEYDRERYGIEHTVCQNLSEFSLKRHMKKRYCNFAWHHRLPLRYRHLPFESTHAHNVKKLQAVMDKECAE